MTHAREGHLKKAPITEAVIDLRVTLAKPFSLEMVDGLRTVLEPHFTSVEEQRRGMVAIDLPHAAVASAADVGVCGLVFKSTDRNDAVQVSDVGFAFSKLPPYSNWEDVFKQARKFWQVYAEIVPVSVIGRTAVRYINHFIVPRHRELTEYLTAVAVPPATVREQMIESTFTRFIFCDAETHIRTRMIQLSQNAQEAGTNVIIDSDCYRVGDFDPTDESFWSGFEELRRMKNRIFFGSITPFAREEFDK